MKLQYKMPDIDNVDLTITVTMTVDEWRKIMLSSYHSAQDDFKNLISCALGDVARLSTATYNQPIKE